MRASSRHSRAYALSERARLHGSKAALAFRRFISLYKKYDDDQPRDERGRWTEWVRDVDETGSITPIRNDARTGILEIDSITDKLLDKLAQISDELGDPGGFLSGIALHHALAERVESSGIPGLSAETTWFDGASLLRYGFPGSVRTDVVLRNYDDTRVLAIWDLKTGDARLSPSRVDQIRTQVGVGTEVPVIELSLRRGVSLKALRARAAGEIGMSDLLIATRRTLTVPAWQSGIDSQQMLVRLVLDPDRSDLSQGRIGATLGGQPVVFSFKSLPLVSASLRERDGMAYCFETPGRGDLMSCAAGGIAALGYMAAADGGVCTRSGGFSRASAELRQGLDAMLAAFFGKEAEYRARYPDDGGSGGGAGHSSAAAVATLAETPGK